MGMDGLSFLRKPGGTEVYRVHVLYPRAAYFWYTVSLRRPQACDEVRSSSLCSISGQVDTAWQPAQDAYRLVASLKQGFILYSVAVMQHVDAMIPAAGPGNLA